MHALAIRPDVGATNEVLELLLPRRRHEGAQLRTALLIAVALHAVIACLPLPEVDLPLPPPRKKDPIRVTRFTLLAPEIVSRAESRSPIRGRRDEIENRLSPSLAPAEESREHLDPGAVSAAFELDLDDSAIAPPPPVGIVHEDHAGLIRPIASAGRRTPVYPRMAVLSRQQGRVVLRAVISTAGTVESIEVVSAPQPDLGFGEAAVEAVSSWRYEPGRLDGRPVAVELIVTIEFTLAP